MHDLRTSAWIRQLAPEQTTQLENEVSARIATELDEAGNKNDSTVQSILDRLGPAGDLVDERYPAASGAARGPIRLAVAPIVPLRAKFARHGWGVAEIGGLLLLIVGPFLLWWIGPVFGILLVRAAAERWSERAMHIATVVVFALLGVQALMAVAFFGYTAINGGAGIEDLQRIMSSFAPGRLLTGGLVPPAGDSGLPFVIEIIAVWIAPFAGVSSGLYLALSPRYRRQRTKTVA